MRHRASRPTPPLRRLLTRRPVWVPATAIAALAVVALTVPPVGDTAGALVTDAAQSVGLRPGTAAPRPASAAASRGTRTAPASTAAVSPVAPPAPVPPSASPTVAVQAPTTAPEPTTAAPAPVPSPVAAPRTTAAPSPAPAPAAAPSRAVAPAPAAASGPEQQVLELVNEQRAAAGCAAVSWDAPLAALARAHSTDMRDRGFFDHATPDGLDPWDRAAAAGVGNLRAENIAMGQPDAAAVMTAWMNSPGHRRNILDCSLHTLGVGAATGAGGPWWTQDFGA